MNAFETRALSTYARVRYDEDGLSTAELLGNAALAIVALIAIWAVIRGRATDMLNSLFDQVQE